MTLTTDIEWSQHTAYRWSQHTVYRWSFWHSGITAYTRPLYMTLTTDSEWSQHSIQVELLAQWYDQDPEHDSDNRK